MVRVLDQVTALYGRPDQIRLGNGPELTCSHAVRVPKKFEGDDRH